MVVAFSFPVPDLAVPARPCAAQVAEPAGAGEGGLPRRLLLPPRARRRRVRLLRLPLRILQVQPHLGRRLHQSIKFALILDGIF